MIPTYNGKIILRQYEDFVMFRYVSQDAADNIIANNTPLSEWYNVPGATFGLISELRNEDNTPIDIDTQTILISDTPEISDWYISADLKFVQV